MKNSPFPILVGVLFCIGRVWINSHVESDVIVFIMGAFNIIALSYVLFLLVNDVKSSIVLKIQDSQFPEISKEKHKKKLDIISYIIYFLLSTISFVYVLIFYSSVLNDVLSVIALVVSVSEEYFSKMMADLIYEVI